MNCSVIGIIMDMCRPSILKLSIISLCVWKSVYPLPECVPENGIKTRNDYHVIESKTNGRVELTTDNWVISWHAMSFASQ